jgi:hypothetical protein
MTMGKTTLLLPVLCTCAMTTHLRYVYKLFFGALVKYLQLIKIPKYTTLCAAEHI